MSTPIQRIKDQPGGVWAENKSNLIPSAFGAPNRGGTMYVQPYVEEVMRRILKDLEGRGYDLKANPNLFRIVSSHRSQAEQDRLFANAVEKYGTEAKARKYVAKVSAHQTGAVIDIDLGGATKSENIPAFRNSKQFQDWADLAYNKYKMAPYDEEPWHWECGNACKENIERLLREEAKPKAGKIEKASTPARKEKKVVVKSQKKASVPMKKEDSPITQEVAPEEKSNVLLYVALGSVAVLATGAYFYNKQKGIKKPKQKRSRR